MNAPANIESPKLAIRKSYKATTAQVFAAFTRPEALSQWFSPYGGELSAEVDFSVGGKWVIVITLPDGEKATVSGEYLEIIQDKRLVYTWAWGGKQDRVSQVTINLADHGDETQLTLTHTQFFDEPHADRHNMGWEGCLKNLPAYLAKN